MKKLKFFFVFFWIPACAGMAFGFLVRFSPYASAASEFIPLSSAVKDRLEEARVIKIDKERFDTLVERKDGQRWLLQHGRTCTSMSTEWPVQLVFDNKEAVKKIKVNFNELCDVYTATPIDSEIVIEKYLRSDNALLPDHQFTTTDQGAPYRLDYGTGCRYLYELEGKKVYLYRGGATLTEGKSKIFMPENRGACVIQKVTALSSPDPASKAAEPAAVQAPAATQPLPAMPPIQYQAQNNQVYFYWDKPATDNILHYAYAYSRYALDPRQYELKQLPGLRRTKENQATVTNLANNRLYTFFFAPVTVDQKVGQWTTIQATPVNTTKPIKNNPDFEPFDVKQGKETDKAFTLAWNAMQNVKKYRVTFFVNGHFIWTKDVTPDVTSVTIEKKPEYLNKGLRLTVSTLQIDPIGPKYSDGIYWVYALKKK